VSGRLSLALAIHNHQPVGNFGWIYQEAYRQAYLPLLEALERHPSIRLALHYSGPLLQWLVDAQPTFPERLAALVARGQVELMGGGYYEPILIALPERDRVGQLRRMADELERMTGARPSGAWLAERVWEPSLPATLADAGYRWTILDDVHFRAASIPPDEAWGPWSTDDQGRRIDVFATDQRLRYGIPFSEPETIVDYLRAQAGDDERLATMGDDGEKFGSWPGTFAHCWGPDRWVERFLEALEAESGWLSTTTPSDWLSGHAPIGRAYIPTASYIEMTEWALPPDESVAFRAALDRATEAEAPEARWLRGGFWRTYQARYREINDLHKAMLRTSDRVAAMSPGPARERALDHLYQGQSNDTYWHGVFGGVYINHLRLATWEHLIAAEDIAARQAPAGHGGMVGTGRAVLVDADLDGLDEALLESDAQLVIVDLAEGGGIGEWDLRAPRLALAAVLRRRPEAAHVRLLEAERSAAADVDGDAQAAADEAAGSEATTAAEPADGGAPAVTIHERIVAKEAGLAERVAYDWHERRSGLVHLLDPDVTQEDFAAAAYVDRGDFVDRPFDVQAITPGVLRLRRDGTIWAGGDRRPLRVDKVLTMDGGRADPGLRLEVSVENRSPTRMEVVLAVEWALDLLGGGGNPQAWYEIGGRRTTHDGWAAHEPAGRIAFGNDWLGVAVDVVSEPAASVWWQPIETISNSEGGFERIYQGSALVFRWPLRLQPGASTGVSMALFARCARDRRAEEEAA
jgi:alpha-amylase